VSAQTQPKQIILCVNTEQKICTGMKQLMLFASLDKDSTPTTAKFDVVLALI